MRKILFAAGAMIALAGAAMAAASEPLFEPVQVVDVSAEFDVMPALPDIAADVDQMAYAEDQPVDCTTHERCSHAIVASLILSAQSDVMPDFALSGGDGRPI